MNIRTRETIYVLIDGEERVIRHGTIGVEKRKSVLFYDNTRTVAVAFEKETCLEMPQLFQVSRTLEDKDISSKDVISLIKENVSLSQRDKEELIQQIQIL